MTQTVYAKITYPTQTREPNVYVIGYYTDAGHGNMFIEASGPDTAIAIFWATSGFTPQPLIKNQEV